MSVQKSKLIIPKKPKILDKEEEKDKISIVKYLLNKTQTIKKSEEDFLYTVKIAKMDECNVNMNLFVELKLKHLIEQFIEILKFKGHEISLNNYNLNDPLLIIDSLGAFLSSTNYYSKEEMQELLENNNFFQKIEITKIMLEKYLSLVKNNFEIHVNFFFYNYL